MTEIVSDVWKARQYAMLFNEVRHISQNADIVEFIGAGGLADTLQRAAAWDFPAFGSFVGSVYFDDGHMRGKARLVELAHGGPKSRQGNIGPGVSGPGT